jgi:hypothetical protein
VLFDWGFFCPPAVLGGDGGGEVPFYAGSTRNEGDIIEVNDLDWLTSVYNKALGLTDFEVQFELWLR